MSICVTRGQASGCEYLGEVLDKCVVRMDVWVTVLHDILV